MMSSEQTEAIDLALCRAKKAMTHNTNTTSLLLPQLVVEKLQVFKLKVKNKTLRAPSLIPVVKITPNLLHNGLTFNF